MVAIDKPGTKLTKDELLEKIKESNNKIVIYNFYENSVHLEEVTVLGVAYDLNNEPIELVLESSTLGCNDHISILMYLRLGDGCGGFAFTSEELKTVNEYFDPNTVLERTLRRRLTAFVGDVFNVSTYKQMPKEQKIKIIKEAADAAINQIEVNNEEN